MKFLSTINTVKKFVTEDVWTNRYEKSALYKLFFIKQLRIILLSYKGFNEDKCMQKASALTYYSLLSIVPIFAMVIGFAKGFGFEKALEDQLMNQFADKKELFEQLIAFANSMLDNTKSGLIAGIGGALLIWSVLKVLGSIEIAFNDIWEIKKQRTPVRKLTDYLAITLIVPMLFILSKSTINYITDFVALKAQTVPIFIEIGGVIAFFMKLIPYSIIWFVFTFLYMIIPNAKVRFRPAFLGGLVAGILFQLLQWGYVEFQVGVARYNAIYGSFAALPLFLIWMNTSWVIMLLGAEIAYARQNVSKYESESHMVEISKAYRQKVSVYIMYFIVSKFRDGKPAPTVSDISEELGIPSRLVRNICYELVDAHLASEVKTSDENDYAFQPSRDIDGLTVSSTLKMLMNAGLDTVLHKETKEYNEIFSIITQFEKSAEALPLNKKLKDI